MRSPRLAGLPGLAGLIAVALLGVSACTAVPGSVVAPSADPTVSESPSPTATVSPTPPPVDPIVTAEVCTQASTATAMTTAIFNEQIGALEQAAARNDQAGMVAAAEAINKQFVALAQALTALAQRPVGPELTTVLTDISTALTQMSSLAYTGTTVDIRKKLLDFAAAFEHSCAPSTSPSPTA